MFGCWDGAAVAGAGVLLAVVPAFGSPPASSRIHTVNSRIVDINYAVNTVAPEPSRAELWYTIDGENWRLYSQSHDPRPPIRFRAARDGVHGFYIIVANAHGASSTPPEPGEPPHRWVLIDTVRPLVQVKHIELVPRSDDSEATLAVVWTAHDDHLSDRPISIYYQIRESPGWQLMASNIANLGRFDWNMPEDLAGELEVRVDVVDEAGNRTSDRSDALSVQARDTPNDGTHAVGQGQPALPGLGQDDQAGVERVDAESRRRAHDLYERGVWRRTRGELDLATQRLTESMNLDPSMATPAFELAEIYYLEGHFDRAIDIYTTILSRRPEDRDALRGMALAHVGQKQYPEALAALERVLLQHPRDAQTWLDAGDVFVWMGQRQQARRHWKKAREVAERGSDVRRQVELKLRNFSS